VLEWDNLRFVLEIKRGGSMQAAAQALGVDRGTVLRRLDALEAQLNARLFDDAPLPLVGDEIDRFRFGHGESLVDDGAR